MISTGAAPRAVADFARGRWYHGKSLRQALHQFDFGIETEIAMRFARVADRHSHIADPRRNITRRERNTANLRDGPRQFDNPRPSAGTYIKHKRFFRDREPHCPTQRPYGIGDIDKVTNLG